MDQDEAAAQPAGEQAKVFVSYSRTDVADADQLVLAIEDKGYNAVVDRHDIDATEKWKDRLAALIFACDTIVFVLTEASAASATCAWEVEEAERLGKRIIPVVPKPFEGKAPRQLSARNYILFYPDPAIPGSGFYQGLKTLDRALQTDLTWLRESTRLGEQASHWLSRTKDKAILLRDSVLTDALNWAATCPPGHIVTDEVQSFLDESLQEQDRRRAEAKAGIVEKEAALYRARQATKRVQRVTLAGLGATIALAGLAIWALWLGTDASLDASEKRAQLFASEARKITTQTAKPEEAVLMSLYADPAATRGFWQRLLLKETGYETALDSLSFVLQHAAPLAGVFDIRDTTSKASLRDLSGNGQYAVSFHEDYTIMRVWSVGDQTLLFEKTTDGERLRGAKFSTDSNYVTVWYRSGALKFYDLKTGDLVKETAIDGDGVGSILYVPSRDVYVLSIRQGPNRTVGSYICSFDDDTILRAIPESGYVPPSVAPNESFLASVSGSIWSLETLEKVSQLKFEGNSVSPDDVRYIEFDMKTTQLVVGLRKGFRSHWSVKSGNLIFKRNAYAYDATSASIAPTNDFFVAADQYGELAVNPLKDDYVLNQFIAHTDYIVDTAFKPDGLSFLSADQWGEIRTWHASLGQPVKTRFQVDDVSRISLSPDENMFAAVRPSYDFMQPSGRKGFGFKVDILSSQDGSILTTLSGHADDITQMRFSSDGRYFVSLSEDAAIKVWSLPDGTLVKELRAGTGYTDAVFVPTNNAIRFLGASGRIEEYSFTSQTNKTLKPEIGDLPDLLRMSGSGDLVISSTGSAAYVWSTKRPEPLAELRGHSDDITAIAISPDGRYAATVSDDETFKVWQTDTGEPIGSLLAEDEHDAAIAFVPNTALLAIAQEDEPIWIWSLNSRSIVAKIDTIDDGIASIDFSADGRIMWAAGWDEKVYRIEMPSHLFGSPRARVKMACDKLRDIGAPLAFQTSDIQRYPILAGEPLGADGALWSPCEGI